MEIKLIGEDGRVIGNMRLSDARKIARNEGKDLVRVGANQDIYKIADAGKLKYDLKRKEKRNRTGCKKHKMKEVRLRPSIAKHDLEVKVKRVKSFLDKGMRTKVTMILKGRLPNKDLALNKMNEFIVEITQGNSLIVDKAPKFEGRNLVAFLKPIK